jgi:hypothetical protein
MDASAGPQEPGYELLNEIARDLANHVSVKKMFPRLSDGEKAGAVRGFALAGLLFQARGQKQLLDKLDADGPEWKENEQVVNLLETIWLLAAEEALWHLRRIPRDKVLLDILDENHPEWKGDERVMELMAAAWLLGVEEVLRYLRWIPG